MKIIPWNKTNTDCGIVAIANAVAWCNLGKTYSDVEKAAKSCGYGKKGIHLFQLVKLVKKLKIPAKRYCPKSIDDLEERLYEGKFFIFVYTPTSDKAISGHVVTAFTDHTGKIRIINQERGSKASYRRFMGNLARNGVKNFVAWEIPGRHEL